MFSFSNPHNYVRPETLTFPSIEFFALITIFIYVLYLLIYKKLNLEKLFFLFLPFSDVVFRIYGVQPVEILIIGFFLLNQKGIKITPVISIAFTFIFFSFVSYFNPAASDIELQGLVKSGVSQYGDLYSLLYSFRFALTALFFSTIINHKFKLDLAILKFAVVFAFLVTFTQVFLWLLGLPIDGIFFNGIIPRAKGLAHEPATWSIWIISLFPYILHFRLGKKYLVFNSLTLFMTFSTFGFVSLIGYIILLSVNHIIKQKNKTKLGINKNILNILFFALLSFLLFFTFASEKLTKFFDNFFALFEKLIYYFQEFSLSAQGQDSAEGLSGRSGDFTIFKDYFDSHWLLGIGSFKTSGLETSATNFYLLTPIEIGLLGIFILIPLFALHYFYLYKKSHSVYFFLFSLNFLLMIAGIRCFSFHELWYAQANTIRVLSNTLRVKN